MPINPLAGPVGLSWNVERFLEYRVGRLKPSDPLDKPVAFVRSEFDFVWRLTDDVAIVAEAIERRSREDCSPVAVGLPRPPTSQDRPCERQLD